MKELAPTKGPQQSWYNVTLGSLYNNLNRIKLNLHISANSQCKRILELK